MNILIPLPYWGHTVASGLVRSLGEKNNLFLAPYSNAPEDKNTVPLDIQSRIKFTELKTDLDSSDHKGEFDDERQKVIEEQFLQLSEKYKIDLIIPQSGNIVDMLARSDKLRSRTYLPSYDVITLARNKQETGNFLRGLETVGIPESEVILSDDAAGLEKIILQNGSRFVKPNTAEGSNGAYEINSIGDFLNNREDTPYDLIVSELLQRPETNHTVIVKDGKIIAQATYRSRDTGVGVAERTTSISDRRYCDAALEIIEKLVRCYGNEQVDGVYNMDFLTRKGDSRPILTEINAGRFPGGHTTYVNAGANLPQFLVNIVSGDNRGPTPSYMPGINHEPSHPLNTQLSRVA